VSVLALTLEEHHLKPDTFVAPVLGQAIIMPPLPYALPSTVLKVHYDGEKLFNSRPPVNMNLEAEVFR
jgi:hypothetical protein